MTPPSDTALPSFGPRLKRLRKAASVKQSALADLLGVDQATVSRWENGAQRPAPAMQQHVLAAVAAGGRDDQALKRLVERSWESVHLIDDVSHVCLAYSTKRAQAWGTSPRSYLGETLWPFATDEIRVAEAALADSDWWSAQLPDARIFQTSASLDQEMVISAGWIRWERLYLGDGTPVRLVTSA